MPPPSSNDIEITNYDVLADQVSHPSSSDHHESDDSGGLSLAAHSYHVGNNRLEVLCNIHHRAFSEAVQKGETTQSAHPWGRSALPGGASRKVV